MGFWTWLFRKQSDPYIEPKSGLEKVQAPGSKKKIGRGVRNRPKRILPATFGLKPGEMRKKYPLEKRGRARKRQDRASLRGSAAA